MSKEMEQHIYSFKNFITENSKKKPDSKKLTYDEIKKIFIDNDFDFSHNHGGDIYYHLDYHLGVRYSNGNDYIECLQTDEDFNEDKIIGEIKISGLSSKKLNKKIKKFVESGKVS